MVYATPNGYMVELETFTGSRASAATIGLTEFRSESRDPGADPLVAWSAIDSEDYFAFTEGGERITPGTVFKRQAIETAPGVFSTGPWEVVGDTTALEGRFQPCNPNRAAVGNPGEAMRTPIGVILRDETGAPILRERQQHC